MPFTSGYNTNCCQLEHSSTIRSVVIGGSACPLPPPPCSRVHSRRQHRNLPLRPPNKASDTKGPVAIVHVPCKGDDTLDKSSPSAWGGYRSFGSKLHDAYRRVLYRDLKRRLIAKSLLGADILSVAVCGLYAVITCTVQRSISHAFQRFASPDLLGYLSGLGYSGVSAFRSLRMSSGVEVATGFLFEAEAGTAHLNGWRIAARACLAPPGSSAHACCCARGVEGPVQ